MLILRPAFEGEGQKLMCPGAGYEKRCRRGWTQNHLLDSVCASPSYIIEKGVCYLVLCESAFPKKLAFAYLEDLHSEFDEQHGKKVPTVSRPYSFIEFGEVPLQGLARKLFFFGVGSSCRMLTSLAGGIGSLASF